MLRTVEYCLNLLVLTITGRRQAMVEAATYRKKYSISFLVCAGSTVPASTSANDLAQSTRIVMNNLPLEALLASPTKTFFKST